MTVRNVLSIAGSDPSGGAGIQADLKTFSARGTYGMAALTALTAQNTQGVTAVLPLPVDFVISQIDAILDDISVDAIKIGMIANAKIAEALGELLARRCDSVPIVLDPVMMAKGGSPLLAPTAITAVRDHLAPLATVITPNLPEAAALLGEAEATSRDAMADQALRLRLTGPDAVLIKGGHLDSGHSPDVLSHAAGLSWFEAQRITTKNTHGTGCSLSSAIAAEIAKGVPLIEAISIAKVYLTSAIAAADNLSVGSGHGPVHHFTDLWRQ